MFLWSDARVQENLWTANRTSRNNDFLFGFHCELLAINDNINSFRDIFLVNVYVRYVSVFDNSQVRSVLCWCQESFGCAVSMTVFNSCLHIRKAHLFFCVWIFDCTEAEFFD